jgi:alkylated DNA repair dioxygenase AlkB
MDNHNDNNIIEVEEVEDQGISGLYYIDDIKEDNISQIIIELDKLKWVPLSNNANSRLVQHYGYKYDYKTYNIRVKCDDIPPFLISLKTILTDICLEMNIIKNDYVFNQCIVNNYLPGQGISQHTDVKSYGDVIGCFTLGGGTTMTFKNGNKKIDLYVKPNSLYIMSGDARYVWKHELSPKKYDIIDGNKINRLRRISVTFRNVPV